MISTTERPSARQRIELVEEGKPDTLLSAARANELARAIGAFCNIKGGRGVTRIAQRGFRWRDLEEGSVLTVLDKGIRDELFAAVNGFSRTTGSPEFHFIVSGGNVRLVNSHGLGGTQVVEPPKDGEHLLQANVANRLVGAVNNIWRCEADGFDLTKADDGWIIALHPNSAGYCTYLPAYDKPSIPLWEVLSGTLDLIGRLEPDGPELDDFMSGSGMYWDLAGTTAPQNGILQNKFAIELTAGTTYTLGFQYAGNQRDAISPGNYVSRVQIQGPSGSIGGYEINETFEPSYNGAWFTFVQSFVASQTRGVQIRFQQITRGSPRFGNLIDRVYLKNDTSGNVVFFDDFDGRYHCATGLPFDEPTWIP